MAPPGRGDAGRGHRPPLLRADVDAVAVADRLAGMAVESGHVGQVPRVPPGWHRESAGGGLRRGISRRGRRRQCHGCNGRQPPAPVPQRVVVEGPVGRRPVQPQSRGRRRRPQGRPVRPPTRPRHDHQRHVPRHHRRHRALPEERRGTPPLLRQGGRRGVRERFQGRVAGGLPIVGRRRQGPVRRRRHGVRRCAQLRLRGEPPVRFHRGRRLLEVVGDRADGRVPPAHGRLHRRGGHVRRLQSHDRRRSGPQGVAQSAGHPPHSGEEARRRRGQLGTAGLASLPRHLRPSVRLFRLPGPAVAEELAHPRPAPALLRADAPRRPVAQPVRRRESDAADAGARP
mmetsp:Transcript_10963/g.25845  ORF Transcript_10963/g.25845 Transcript_10963/m.25845 type:complete len:342 (-) Transcript_10963:720-1745(-)